MTYRLSGQPLLVEQSVGSIPAWPFEGHALLVLCFEEGHQARLNCDADVRVQRASRRFNGLLVLFCATGVSATGVVAGDHEQSEIRGRLTVAT